MPESLSFAINCPTRGRIQLQTNRWWVDQDGVIHYWALCPCGNEHFGFLYAPCESEPAESVRA
jgi:hypothetical protein